MTVSEAAIGGRRGNMPRSSLMRRIEENPFSWLLPVAILLGVFYLYPIFDVLRLAFTNASLRGGEEHYTVDSFVALIANPALPDILWTTFVFTAGSVVGQQLFGLGIAVLVMRGERRRLYGMTALRTIVLIAWVIPGIANGLVSCGPQLGAGAAIGTGLAAGGVVMAAGAAAGAVASGGASLAGGAAAAARGGAAMAGGASTAYSLGAAGQSGAAGVTSGLGSVANAGAQAAVSPLKRAASRAAADLKSSFSAGARTASEATGGSSTMGTVGGDAAEASSSPTSATASGSPPDWAKRMKRSQSLSHGVQSAAHAVRSGDAHGGGSSVNLSESDR